MWSDNTIDQILVPFLFLLFPIIFNSVNPILCFIDFRIFIWIVINTCNEPWWNKCSKSPKQTNTNQHQKNTNNPALCCYRKFISIPNSCDCFKRPPNSIFCWLILPAGSVSTRSIEMDENITTRKVINPTIVIVPRTLFLNIYISTAFKERNALSILKIRIIRNNLPNLIKWSDGIDETKSIQLHFKKVNLFPTL